MQNQSSEAIGLRSLNAAAGFTIYCWHMKPELLAAAYLLQRLHGAAFAAALLEEHGMSRVLALRLLADRPLRLLPDQGCCTQYPNQMVNLDYRK